MPQSVPRCQLVPEPVHTLRFLIDGETRLAWNFHHAYPRPFFYPLIGPASVPLTRMGHPGAPNHDHHQSVWFAHAAVSGTDFWSNRNAGRIEQVTWQCYEDGDEQAAMAVRLDWKKPDDTVLMTQALTAILRPLPGKECLLELQTTLSPADDQPLTLDPSNFGLLAVRVSRDLSVHFGGGKLTSSEGAQSEAEGFGQFARWWDDSGPVKNGATSADPAIWNGITYFDHPANPGHPAHWHIREDGWMGASLTRLEGLEVRRDQPLKLRYLLHVHDGAYDPAAARAVALSFQSWPWMNVRKSSRKHRTFEFQPEAVPSSPHELP